MNDIPPVNPATNWRTALADLLGARLALIQLELKQAAQAGVKRGLLFAGGALALLFAWGILAAGIIGAVSACTGLAWYWVALITGGVHLIAAIILIVLGKRPSPGASFEITVSEFKKDRAWLETLQPKSND